MWLLRQLCWCVAALLALQSVAMGFEQQGLDLQGHRGARGLFPENTLAGFAAALRIGVSTLEMDLGISLDGVVVVSHNPRMAPEITRDAEGAWLLETGEAIHALTLAQIKGFDVGGIKPGTRYSRRFPQQQPVRPARVPTLAEVLRLVKRSGNKLVRLNLETKLRPDEPGLTPAPRAFVQAILKVVGAHGFMGRVTLQSFDWRTLSVVQEIAPGVPTVYLSAQQGWLDNIQRGRPGASPWMAGLDIDQFDGDVPRAVKAAGGSIWSPYHREVDAEAVRRAQGLGLKVIVWTVNEPARMNALIGMGVDGIISDYPGRLRKVLLERGLAVPEPTPAAW